LFQFSDSQEKNLPSKEASLNASVHSDESQRGKTTWSTLCQAMVSIIRESAQVLYPGAPEILIDNAVHREMVVHDRPRELIALINTRSPVKVERYIFTETQDGKDLLDAHFAMRQ
jgi:hypothetical protein